MLQKLITFVVIFFVKVNLVESGCDNYNECLDTFLGGFFGNISYFHEITEDISGKDSKQDFGDGDLNKILLDVSSLLQNELNKNPLNVYSHSYIDNNTSIFVKTISIDDVNLNVSTLENEAITEFNEINLNHSTLSGNKSYLMEKNSILKNGTTFDSSKFINLTDILMPLNFNVSYFKNEQNDSFRGNLPIFERSQFINVTEYLVPLNLNVSNFSQIKIETFSPINEKDERENEIPDTDTFEEYYDFIHDNSTDYPIIDYIELYKDTTNEEIDFKPTENSDVITKDSDSVTLDDVEKIEDTSIRNIGSAYEVISTNIYPWLAAIFTRIESGDQFNYYCDGALLSEDVVITAARCIRGMNSSATPADLVVLLGKTSLHTMADGEKVAKVKEIHIHENYTTGTENDVAVLLLQDAVELSESIQPAKLRPLQVYDAAYTTGWAFSGELSLIHFKNNNSGGCDQHTDGNRTICADYDDDVSVCPSYGGLYVVRSEGALYLHGIRTGDPSDRLLCSNRSIIFTVLQSFSQWISKFCPRINSIST